MLLAALGAATTASLFGAKGYRWRAFTLRLSVEPRFSGGGGGGETRLVFTPVGEVRARTHAPPVVFNIGLEKVAFEEVQRLVARTPPRRELEREFRAVAHRTAWDFSRRLLGLGALGALLAPVLLRARSARGWIAAPLLGASFMGIVLALTFWTYRPEAFRRPTYTGSLRQAPWAISLVTGAVSNTEALGARLRNVASGVQALYGRINTAGAVAGFAGPDAPETIRVLHISDLHNNPAAVAFVRDLARRFDVAAVIDTGDLTDFGTPVETRLTQGLGQLGVPYVFVAGNHDSEATMRAVAATPNAVVLGRSGYDNGPVTVAGLRLLGSPDPSARREGAGDVNTPPEDLQAEGEALLSRYRASDPPPDIVCVHNPRQAAPLLGTAKVVLCGHMHRAYVETESGTVVCNAGTTGASGARYFERAEGVPFSAALLHFLPGDAEGRRRPRLLFIDQVVLQGSLSEYSITRRTFGNGPHAPDGGENGDAAAGVPAQIP